MEEREQLREKFKFVEPEPVHELLPQATILDSPPEFEAAIDNPDAPVTFYRNRTGLARWHDKGLKIPCLLLVIANMSCLVVLSTLLIAMLRNKAVTPALWDAYNLPAFLTVVAAIGLCMMLLQRRKQMDSVVPVIELRPTGMIIDAAISLSWDEIRCAESRWGTIRIVPTDLSKTLSSMVGKSDLVVPWMRAVPGLFESISVPADWLPVSAEDIVEQINLRRIRALPLDTTTVETIEYTKE